MSLRTLLRRESSQARQWHSLLCLRQSVEAQETASISVGLYQNSSSNTQQRCISMDYGSRSKESKSSSMLFHSDEGFGSATRRLYHKATTGIVGLPMDEQAREHLKEKLAGVLQALDEHSIPATAAYRRGIEERCTEKLNALSSESYTDEELEGLFGRQLEQEIKMCDDELALIPKMAEWKPWDVDSESHTIRVVEDVDEEEEEEKKSSG